MCVMMLFKSKTHTDIDTLLLYRNNNSMFQLFVHWWSSKINWKAQIRLSFTNYKPPSGFWSEDHVQFKYHAETANAVFENQRKIDSLAEDLKTNGDSDFYMKIVMGVPGACGFLGALVNQIQRIKTRAKNLWNAVPRNEPVNLPKYQSQIF